MKSTYESQSEACHHFNIQALSTTCARAWRLVYNLVQLNMVEAIAEAGTQQIGAVDGRQRNQWASTLQRQCGYTHWRGTELHLKKKNCVN